jgi:hypothetical protein
MQRAVVLCVLSLLLVSIQILPQQTPASTATIEGVVVRSDSGAPIANAQVQLLFVPAVQAGGVPAALAQAAAAGTLVVDPNGGFVLSQGGPAGARPTFQPVSTGSDGKFVFKDVAAGGYRLAATADGFVRQEYGQRTVTGQGRPVFVTAGQTLKDATIRLIATGIVSGRVFDENGQPATGAQVQLIRSAYTPQGRSYQPTATGAADDRGDYRMYGVPPGKYLLAAGTPPGPARLRGAGGVVTTARFSMVYYPNVEEMDQSSTIEVKSGAETAVDMRVRRQTQTYRVRGRVVDATGAGLRNLNLSLAYRFLTGGGTIGSGNAYNATTSTFELQNVAPGDYTVQAVIQQPQVNEPLPVSANGVVDQLAVAARQATLASRPMGQVAIRVVDTDVENVVVTVSAGVTVAGRLTVEGQNVASLPNLERIRVALFTPVVQTFNVSSPVALPPQADGSFQVVGLREGEFRIQIPAPQGFYVKSAQYGGDDILSKPLKFSGSSSGSFEIVLRPGGSQVSGTVTDARALPVVGIPVFLIPVQRGRNDLYRQGVTDQTGKFNFAAVPPGEYRAFSWEAIESGAPYDPDFLKQYETQGKAVTVTDASTPTLDVRMIPAQ